MALNALTFLGNSEDALLRFVAQSSLQPKDLLARVEESGVQAAILDFLLSDDELLLAFCAAESLQPRQVHLAKHRLEQGSGRD